MPRGAGFPWADHKVHVSRTLTFEPDHFQLRNLSSDEMANMFSEMGIHKNFLRDVDAVRAGDRSFEVIIAGQ